MLRRRKSFTNVSVRVRIVRDLSRPGQTNGTGKDRASRAGLNLVQDRIRAELASASKGLETE